MVHILLAEHPLIVGFITAGLQGLGHTVTIAHGTAEVVRVAQDDRCDVIVVGLRASGLDGRTVIANLREAGSSTPILLLHAPGEDEEALERLGANALLAKPFPMSLLQDRLSALG
jgi:two-component system response regulator TctD